MKGCGLEGDILLLTVLVELRDEGVVELVEIRLAEKVS
jgi:hypothetical protein